MRVPIHGSPWLPWPRRSAVRRRVALSMQRPNLVLETSALAVADAAELGELARTRGAYRLAYGSGTARTPAAAIRANVVPADADIDPRRHRRTPRRRDVEHDLPMSARSLLVLDGLFDDLDVETAVAAARGWSVRRWDGSEPQLLDAEVVLHVRTRVDRALIGRMPACRVVARFGTGLDTVDHAAAAERGIRVVGVRDYCIPELASLTLGLAFALDRRVDGVRDRRARRR